ncbi:hypothetical protein BC829DRAFT_241660 [Chytridium lagenaria]|nr:hypothetical protein BC829DRAFT_241660 [Chytridium lagenaria]
MLGLTAHALLHYWYFKPTLRLKITRIKEDAVTMDYQQLPKITVVFLGFPSSSNPSAAGPEPARIVVSDLPPSNPARPITLFDIIAKLKRDHFFNDPCIDMSRAIVYRGPPDFFQMTPSSPVGLLGNGDFLLVVCSNSPNLQTSQSTALVLSQHAHRLQPAAIQNRAIVSANLSPWDQHVRFASSPPPQTYPSFEDTYLRILIPILPQCIPVLLAPLHINTLQSHLPKLPTVAFGICFPIHHLLNIRSLRNYNHKGRGLSLPLLKIMVVTDTLKARLFKPTLTAIKPPSLLRLSVQSRHQLDGTSLPTDLLRICQRLKLLKTTKNECSMYFIITFTKMRRSQKMAMGQARKALKRGEAILMMISRRRGVLKSIREGGIIILKRLVPRNPSVLGRTRMSKGRGFTATTITGMAETAEVVRKEMTDMTGNMEAAVETDVRPKMNTNFIIPKSRYRVSRKGLEIQRRRRVGKMIHLIRLRLEEEQRDKTRKLKVRNIERREAHLVTRKITIESLTHRPLK